MPHASHLAQVLAQHEFQEAFKNYRDLRFLAKNLDGWREKLGVFDDMLGNRRQAFADRLPQVRDDAGKLEHRPRPTKRRDALAAELAAVRERGRRRRVRRRQATALQSSAWPTLQAADAARRLRPRSRRAARARAPRRRRARPGSSRRSCPTRCGTRRRRCATIDTELELAQARDAALAQAQRDEPARFEAFAKRIAALEAHDPRADPARGRAQPASSRGQVQEHRRRRARAPEGTPRRLHHAGALRGGAALRPRRAGAQAR